MGFMIAPQTFDCHRASHSLGSLFACLTLAALSVSGPANAEPDTNGNIFSLVSVADSELDRLRGGFRTPSGLEITFGIRELTLINGHIEHESLFNSHEFIHNTSASETHHDTINTRHGITSSALIDATKHLSSIQNNLDNQRIQSISIFDIRISNLFTLRSGLSTSRWIAESARDF